MTLSTARCVEAITEYSRDLAADARDHLRKRVEHCPDWNVADLVWHVSDVHWFWRTIAAERLDAPPDEARRPLRPGDDELVDTFLAGADALVETLGNADQSASCWTWFPPQQDVAFITRHQVQEALVHRWDAGNAAGRRTSLAPDLSADAVEEFLSTSLADDDDAKGADVELGDDLVLHATDTDQWWTVGQADADSALLWSPASGEPTVEGSASDLLLWVYGRVPLRESKPNLVNRFRKLSST